MNHGEKMTDLITENLYNQYLAFLLDGRRDKCADIVQNLLNQSIDIKILYTDLFQRSLYQVGELWELNRISVSREHMATAITEGLLSLTYPRLFDKKKVTDQKNRVVVSCVARETHQVGGRMVADIFELLGWDSHFLGANTPVDHLLAHIQEETPDLLGLSLSIYFNFPVLKDSVEKIRNSFSSLDIFIGGQAFRYGGIDEISKWPNVQYIPSLSRLEEILETDYAFA